MMERLCGFLPQKGSAICCSLGRAVAASPIPRLERRSTGKTCAVFCASKQNGRSRLFLWKYPHTFSAAMTRADFQQIAPTIPKAPGVYRFIDAHDTVIYVGKAKNLKSRLSSYFSAPKRLSNKTRTMLKNAARIEYTLVETEQDALLLENTLIKKLQPRYNVMLKDGKSYAYICIKNERFPRVFYTRKLVRDGSEYFGPYTSLTRVRHLLELFRMLFPLRTCHYQLSASNIQKGKFKLCLEYHIKNCNGPCVGLESEEAYNARIDQIRNILKGRFGAVRRYLREEMQRLAENLEFEKAQQLKEKLSAFEDYQGKSTVVSTTIRDVDVFSIATDERHAYVNYLKVVNGAIIHAWTQEMVKNLDVDERELLAFAVVELRQRFHSLAPEVIVPFDIALPQTDLRVTIPRRGDKRKLLELSQKNVQHFLMQKKSEEVAAMRRQTRSERLLRTLQRDLHMDELPLHIECFDNSHIQGAFPVSACVVFKNAKPSKRDYRHYHIKTVEGPDDFASMEEVVYRRYRRLLREGKPLPQLVLVDGGKGQLNAAMKALRALGLEGRMTVVGIAKRLEEIYFPDDPVPLHIDKKSEGLKLIQQIRNEAHRFALGFHRRQRTRHLTHTVLTELPGIGPRTARKLLSSFGSVRRIRQASQEELVAVAGRRAAMAIARWKASEREEEE